MSDARGNFDQALFGYDDGHRLLETSARFGVSEREKLLFLSDLAPGLSNLKEDGYWTGSPLPETSRYALMRTWPAWEMPRPGCVWTHVIVIPYTYLQQVWDLTDLLHLFRRPLWPPNREPYAFPILPENLKRVANGSHIETKAIVRSDLLDCAYIRRCTGIPAASQEILGQQALTLWSQQWSELRCSFSFRTIGRPAFGKSTLLNFDLAMVEGQLQYRYDDSLPDSVMEAQFFEYSRDDLAGDLSANQPSGLRQFIRRYGKDLPKRATWVPFLAWVRRMATDVATGIVQPKVLLEKVADAFPRKEEGRLLKSALLSFDSESDLNLRPSAFLSVLSFILEDSRGDSFPPFQESVRKLILELWNDAPQDLLRLIEVAVDRGPTSITTQLIDVLCHISDSAALMDATAQWPSARMALIRQNPSLLDWSGLVQINDEELLRLLEALDPGEIGEFHVVSRLISTPSFTVANYLIEHFPAEVLSEVCIGRGRFGYSFQANDYLLQRAGEMAPKYLSGRFLGGLRSTAALYSFASMLGFVNTRTIEIGSLPWAQSLEVASVDTQETETQILRAFLLALTLARPQKGSESIFEYSLQPLHRAMRDSALPYQASIILEEELPEVSWWRRWDSCQRLRMAVIDAYVDADLDPASFLKLANDPHLMAQMFEILESEYHFRGYLERVRATLAAGYGERPLRAI